MLFIFLFANLSLYQYICNLNQQNPRNQTNNIRSLMFKLQANCPNHNLPYLYISIAQNNPCYLRCKGCPYDPTCLRIDSEQQYMRNRMGQQKTKQRQKSRERSRSRTKRYMPSEEQEEQAIISQKIAEEQVVILELVMKLLAEDKKKYYQHLQKAISEHKKLWKQYDESTRDIMFVNRLCKSDVLAAFIGSLSLKGWQDFKVILKNMHNRAYISQKITKQSAQITEQLRKEGKIRQQTVLRSIQILVSNYKVQNLSQKPQTERNKQNIKQSTKQKEKQRSTGKEEKKAKRSKSFAK